MEEKIYCSHCGELIDTDDYGELDGLYKDWCNVNAIAPEGRNIFYSKVTDYSSKIGRGKFTFGNRNLNGFKGLKYKSNYNDDLYEQPYQDSPPSTQKGEDSE